jgi:hypothetical protein
VKRSTCALKFGSPCGAGLTASTPKMPTPLSASQCTLSTCSPGIGRLTRRPELPLAFALRTEDVRTKVAYGINPDLAWLSLSAL